jgi:hypothetical protein
MKRLAVILSLFLLTGAAGQENPTATFDMDKAGNADMTIEELVDIDVDEANVRVAEDGGLITIGGQITDDYAVEDPDFSFSLRTDDTSADISFEASGGLFADILGSSGDFEFDMVVSEAGESLQIEASGSFDKAFLEDVLSTNISELMDAQLKNDLETSVNEMFSLLPSTIKPTLTVEELSFSGDQRVSFSARMSVSNWKPVMASLLALSYEGDTEGLGLLGCMGLDPEDLADAVLSSELGSITIDTSGSGDGVSAIVTVRDSTNPPIGVSIQSMDLKINKYGATMDIEGSVRISDLQTFMDCITQGYLPGDYTVENVEYTLTKDREGEGIARLQGRIKGLGAKTRDDMELSFPAGVTGELNVTVNVPSGFEILTVEGGTQSGSSIVLNAGEDSRIVYGERKGNIISDNFWLIAIIVILLLLLLLRRRK